MASSLPLRAGRLLGLVILVAAGLLALLPRVVAAETQMTLAIATTDFVLPAKFKVLEGWAEKESIALTVVRPATEGERARARLAAADLLLLDTPRPNDLAALREALGDLLDDESAAWLSVGGGRPAWQGLPPPLAGRLVGYYANGGEANFRAFFRALGRWSQGGNWQDLPPIAELPGSGFYHPDAPHPFATLEGYRSWRGENDQGDLPAGRVAFVIHSGMIADMQTQVVDALIRGVEAQGPQGLAFWFDASQERGLLDSIGPWQPDLLANLTHMQNGRARSAEFLELGIPVVQTLGYREGSPADWVDAESGVPARTAATFLAVPEAWGMSDPLVISALRNGAAEPIPEQIAAFAERAERLATLRRLPNAEKRLALMFWNYPPGEKNLSASNLNVPVSLENLTAALAEAGYEVPPLGEQEVIEAGQRLLAGYYRPETLPELLDDGLAEGFPLARYQAWFHSLPLGLQREMNRAWGSPARAEGIAMLDGEPQFIIPRLSAGRLAILPQPPRHPHGHGHGHSEGQRQGGGYHSGEDLPDHRYFASYLYLRDAFGADALIHFGTHGSQEWLPGKDRGLWAGDAPFLALGGLPVFYPYIQDNVGEAIQAKRRGRAVTISHQTPPFAPAGLYDELLDLHDLVHQYEQLDQGGVRERVVDAITRDVIEAEIHADMGWSREEIAADFDGFLMALHDELHDLAREVTPLGLHRFGQPAAREHRIATVMQQLGQDYYDALGVDPEEVFAADPEALRETLPYRTLEAFLNGAPAPEGLEEVLERGARLEARLAETGEIEALLVALAGGFVAPGEGGDPVRNPEVESGRNLFAFEPDKLPTPAAFEAGEEAFAQLLAAYRADNEGALPEKLAFSLWSSEAIRHQGVVESQVLHALGLRPRWDAGGRVEALEIVPQQELGRPRIDVVIQATSVYRDQFDGFLRLLAEAIERIAALEDEGNVVAANVSALAQELERQGHEAARARRLAALRIFSNAPGAYGTGLPEATLASDAWEEEASLAEGFLARTGFAFGVEDGGLRLEDEDLFARQLTAVDAAVMSRSSNLHGVLSTDHPFEFLGGLSLAVRHLSGESPDLYVSDLRRPEARTTTLGRFLSTELRSRYLNPQWIQAMQAEGYAGTLSIVSLANNLWGWQVTDPASVRDDQWQALHETFVMDRRDLDLAEWFDTHNPTAEAQLLERLLEAARKGYWDAGEDTLRQLVERWQETLAKEAVKIDAPATDTYAQTLAQGFGLAPTVAPPETAAGGAEASSSDDSSATNAQTAEPVSGQVMEPVAATEPPEAKPLLQWLAMAVLGLCFLLGALHQLAANARQGRLELQAKRSSR